MMWELVNLDLLGINHNIEMLWASMLNGALASGGMELSMLREDVWVFCFLGSHREAANTVSSCQLVDRARVGSTGIHLDCCTTEDFLVSFHRLKRAVLESYGRRMSIFLRSDWLISILLVKPGARLSRF